MKVETVEQWVGSTIVIKDDDGIYLRLSNDEQTIWYELNRMKWEFLEDSVRQESAWIQRGRS